MNIGVIGVGNWGHRVIEEYEQLQKEKKIDQVIICEKDKEILEKYDRFKQYTDYKKLIDDSAVDAVHICLPNELHFPVAKYALEHDIHVLMEKPLTLKSEKAYKLAEIASERGVVLEVGHIFRFANVVRRIKEMYEEGVFGDLYYMTFKWASVFKLAQTEAFKDVNIVWDLMPHIFDMVDFITGKEPVQTTVMHKKREVAFLTIDYEEFTANIELSWVTHERKREMRIIGSKASAKVDCVGQHITLYRDTEEKEIPVDANNTIRGEAENFIESVKDGKMKYNSHIIGARNVRTIEKIWE